MKDPQTLAAQGEFGDDGSATFQVTPSRLTSLVTVALTVVVPPTASDAGIIPNVTDMGRLTMVIVMLEACDGSLVTRAVMVTVLSTGIAPGAV